MEPGSTAQAEACRPRPGHRTLVESHAPRHHRQRCILCRTNQGITGDLNARRSWRHPASSLFHQAMLPWRRRGLPFEEGSKVSISLIAGLHHLKANGSLARRSAVGFAFTVLSVIRVQIGVGAMKKCAALTSVTRLQWDDDKRTGQ